MKTPSYTAGIWRSGINAGNLIVVDEKSTVLAQLPSSNEDKKVMGYTPESHANAMLMAAAPELIYALKYLMRESFLNGMVDTEPSMQTARNAIRKAERGES